MEGLAYLRAYLRRCDIELTAEQYRQFLCYREELTRFNRAVNLTAITQPEEIERYHFIDSLTVALAAPNVDRCGIRLCDVGSGAGFPGVPLKIVFPSLRLTVIESVGKRKRFLEHLVSALGLEDVEVVGGRAEEVAHWPTQRESYDIVLARAVAELRVLLEYTLPFCRVGERVVLHKKGDISDELAAAEGALETLGGEREDVVPVPESVLEGKRVLVAVKKRTPTPERFPRRVGVPSKRPL